MVSGQGISGNIDLNVRYVEGPGGAPVSASPAAGGATSPPVSSATQRNAASQTIGIGTMMKRLLPGILGAAGVVGFLYLMLRNSKILNTYQQAIFDILGAMVDVVLAPLTPLLTSILQLLVSFIPLLSSIAKLAEPFVQLLVMLLKPTLDGIKSFIEALIPVFNGVMAALEALKNLFPKSWFGTGSIPSSQTGLPPLGGPKPSPEAEAIVGNMMLQAAGGIAGTKALGEILKRMPRTGKMGRGMASWQGSLVGGAFAGYETAKQNEAIEDWNKRWSLFPVGQMWKGAEQREAERMAGLRQLTMNNTFNISGASNPVAVADTVQRSIEEEMKLILRSEGSGY